MHVVGRVATFAVVTALIKSLTTAQVAEKSRGASTSTWGGDKCLAGGAKKGSEQVGGRRGWQRTDKKCWRARTDDKCRRARTDDKCWRADHFVQPLGVVREQPGRQDRCRRA